MKIYSAGLIITDGIHFLGCKITGQQIYDIPKGKLDGDETPEQACIREVMGETGLKVNIEDIVSLGLYKYIPSKDLYLFYLNVDKMPDLNSLWCSTTFIHPKSGREIPEINGYEYIPWDSLDLYMGKSMSVVLHQIYNEHGKNFIQKNI